MEWYNWPSCNEALARFGRSFLGPTNFKFEIGVPKDPDYPAVGGTNFHTRTVMVNPEAIGKTVKRWPPQAQFEAALGVVAHEVGHGRYTSGDIQGMFTGPEGHLTNVLEDDRIERIMGGKYGVARRALKVGSKMLLKRNSEGMRKQMDEAGLTGKFCATETKTDVADYMLRKLIATRAGMPEALDRDCELHPNNEPIWKQVWPLAQKASVANTTEEVHEYAKQIWDLVKPDEQEQETGPGEGEGEPAEGNQSGQGGGIIVIFREGDETATPEGGGEDDTREEVETPQAERWDPSGKDDKQPEPPIPERAKDPDTGSDQLKRDKNGARVMELPTGDSVSLAGQTGNSIALTGVAPFDQLERAARPLANDLANQLLLPVVHAPREYADRGTRLSVRAAIHTRFEQPFVADSDPMPDGQQLAFAWCTDVSSSMRGPNSEMALIASAMLHMVCVEFDIWHINWTFGTMHYVLPPGISEEDGLARLASLRFDSGTTIRYSLGKALEELMERPEAVKVCFVIHDGMPEDPIEVAKLLENAKADGIEIIGVGLNLGRRVDNMQEMFGLDDFLDCQKVADLPLKLGNAVNELYRIAQQRRASMRIV
jgi:hypothetical protein